MCYIGHKDQPVVAVDMLYCVISGSTKLTELDLRMTQRPMIVKPLLSHF